MCGSYLIGNLKFSALICFISELSLCSDLRGRNDLPVYRIVSYRIVWYRIVSYCIFCLTFLHKHLKNIQREDLFKEFHRGDGQQL